MDNTQNFLWMFPCFVGSIYLGVGCSPSNDLPLAIDNPVLHRLTTKQLENSLAELFDNKELSPLSLPQEIPKDGFYNQDVMRESTPFLVEALERGINRVIQEAISDGGVWLSCHPEQGAEPITCGHEILQKIHPRAWRRPITAEEQLWISTAFDTWYPQVGFDGALQLSLAVILQSPDFVYLTHVGAISTDQDGFREHNDWELASKSP